MIPRLVSLYIAIVLLMLIVTLSKGVISEKCGCEKPCPCESCKCDKGK